MEMKTMATEGTEGVKEISLMNSGVPGERQGGVTTAQGEAETEPHPEIGLIAETRWRKGRGNL